MIKLLTHQTFDVLDTYDEEPTESQVFKSIENKYKKEVVDYKQLDIENYLFTFEE